MVARGAWALGVGLWLLVACGSEPVEPPGDPGAATHAPPAESSSAPAWPLEAVDVFWERPRCDACHGAGLPPDWALENRDIERLVLQRSAGYGYGDKGATLVTTLSESGEAEREVTTVGELPDEGLGSFGATAPVRERGVIDADAFRGLADAVAGSGMVRFEGEAATNVDTHFESAVLRVERRDRAEAWLVSSNVHDDRERHPSVHALFDAFDAAAATVDWSPVPP